MSWYLVGLGNPGSKYKNTRHNAGFLALDFFADTQDFSDWKKKLFSNASISTGIINQEQITLIKPETFMNLSGKAVSKYVKNKDDIEHLIVIQDDVHLPVGSLKISVGRGDGGHNGITSLHQVLKSKDFIRIRVGVAPQKNFEDQNYKIKLDDFVLGKFTDEEYILLKNKFPKIVEIVSSIITTGIENTMNKYNTK